MVAMVEQVNQVEESDWLRCYRDNWKGQIVDDAFAHPAKYSRSLIRRIYQHCQEEGWLTQGQSVVDPFGGVALGGLEAALQGCHWTGVELEEKFVNLGNENIQLWYEKYFTRWPKWGSVRLVQGDSRDLAMAIQSAGLCVSSPPFADSQQVDNRTSPLKAGSSTWMKRQGEITAGRDPRNLSGLRASDESFALAISSPPFVESLASDDPEKRGGLFRDEKRKNDKTLTATYGSTSGQIGAMKEGAFDVAISSPPWEQNVAPHGEIAFKQITGNLHRKATHKSPSEITQDYGDTAGQLGKVDGDSFWTAARQILEQLHLVLSPDAHAVFVLKDFIRNKKRVPFCSQWAALCEAVGFRLLHIHRAWLIDHRGTQIGFDGADTEIKTEKKSFFRLLAERKGSPRIDWETVMCFERVSLVARGE